MNTPPIHKVWKAELRVLNRAGAADGKATLKELNGINREIAKLGKRFDKIQSGLRKRADIRARRISILEGRIHS